MKTKMTKKSVLTAILAALLIIGIFGLFAGVFLKSMLFICISLCFFSLTWLVELFIGEPEGLKQGSSNGYAKDVYRNQ